MRERSALTSVMLLALALTTPALAATQEERIAELESQIEAMRAQQPSDHEKWRQKSIAQEQVNQTNQLREQQEARERLERQRQIQEQLSIPPTRRRHSHAKP